jgi:thioesterase domain-containing protein
VPSHHGHALPYALLAGHLRGVRPVYALDAAAGVARLEESGFVAVAGGYAGALRRARFGSPYVLAGFCFGGAMAYEIARQLSGTDDGPAALTLLGVSPYDFPGLVPPGALDRWVDSMTPTGKLRRAFLFASGLSSGPGRSYVRGRIRQRGRMLGDLVHQGGRARYRVRRRLDSAMVPLHGRYLGGPLSLPVTLVLPSWSVASYCDDPVGMWQGIGSQVETLTVPGVERMMLSRPVVGQVAAMLSRSDHLQGPALQASSAHEDSPG